MKERLNGLFGLLTISLCCGLTNADVLADSVEDFSGVQGQDNWYYGYYRVDIGDTPTNPASFHEAENFDMDFANLWSLHGTGDWLAIGATNQHPHIPGAGRNTVGEYWATRRWVSEVDGEIQITGLLDEGDLGGDGVIVRIHIDGIEIGEWDLLSVTHSMISLDIDATVTVGSTVDLSVAPKNTINFDGTIAELQILGDPVCPADLNGDGALNFLDISAYLSAFGNMDPVADFTDDGSFNFLDVSAYLSAFSMGCP
tara:strand:- start:3928 stop:4695 length:768 start_codon:yes stop_codon:yes gene_type:complete